MEQLSEEVGAAPSLDGSLPMIPLVLPPGLPSMVELRPLVPLGPFCFLCVGSGGCASHSLSGVGFFGADDGVGGGCGNFVPRSSAASSLMAVDASSPSTGRKLVAAVRSSSMVRLGGDLSADCCCGCSSRFEASCGDKGWILVPSRGLLQRCWDGVVGLGLLLQSPNLAVLCVRWGVAL
jgi:hypothetical protein